MRTSTAPGRSATKRRPRTQWRIRVHDKDPAYISWETFEQIQAMRTDNHAEDDRTNTRGIPRPGKALLHGLVYCGACGHTMVVQYKGGTEYLCNYWRQPYRVPVCQYVPADPIDARVVTAFVEALSPVELDVYTQAMAMQRQQGERLEAAPPQQLERLRYEAALCERQFRRVDPDNRLVAAELERRWEAALRELSAAETAYHQRGHEATPPLPLSPEWRAAFLDVGRTLPSIWATEVLSQPQRKAVLRCLSDNVVVHRLRREAVQTRIVRNGGATTTVEVPVTVGAFTALSAAAAPAAASGRPDAPRRGANRGVDGRCHRAMPHRRRGVWRSAPGGGRLLALSAGLHSPTLHDAGGGPARLRVRPRCHAPCVRHGLQCVPNDRVLHHDNTHADDRTCHGPPAD